MFLLYLFHKVVLLGISSISFLWCGDVANMGLLLRQEFRDANLNDQLLVEALDKCDKNIELFQQKWHEQLSFRDQFVVVFIEIDKEKRHIPRALEVTGMDSGSVSGREVGSQLPYRTTNVNITIDWKFVVDVRYREFLFLKYGELFRLYYSRLTPSERRRIRDVLPFGMTDPPAWIDDYIAFSKIPSNHSFLENLENTDEFDVFIMGLREHFVSSTKMSLAEFNTVFGSAETTRILVDKGFYRGSISPMDYCSCSGNLETAKELMKTFDVNETSAELQYTPILSAVDADHYELAHLFLRHGADPNISTFGEENAIFYCHTKEMIDLLVKYGVDVNKKDSSNMTALDRFRQDGNKALADAIENSGGKTSGTSIPEEPIPSFSYNLDCGAILPIVTLP